MLESLMIAELCRRCGGVALGVCLGLFWLSAPAAEFYKWVDEDGNVQYSNKPPPGKEAERLRPYAGKGREAAVQGLRQQSEALDQRRQERHQAEEEQAREQEAQQALAAECARTRKRLASLNSLTRIRREEPADAGASLAYNQEERAAKIAETRQALEEHCR
ncbi:MAG: DUF4124 domain-containing protein [Gammaproteobacteria bacterium]|nr:DUF4124 domain-containing protein [Gammaproteobacteria bacterium]